MFPRRNFALFNFSKRRRLTEAAPLGDPRVGGDPGSDRRWAVAICPGGPPGLPDKLLYSSEIGNYVTVRKDENAPPPRSQKHKHRAETLPYKKLKFNSHLSESDRCEFKLEFFLEAAFLSRRPLLSWAVEPKKERPLVKF